MRKIIFSQPTARSALGLESAEMADIPEMQQADDIRDDVQEDAAEMDQIATEAFTLLTRIAALEDIAEVIETQVQEARPSEVVLVDIATDLATDGTDASEGDVTPGLESALGGTISTEGILEAAKKFVAAVIDRMGAFLNKMKAFLGGAKAMIRVEKRRLKGLAAAAEKMNDASGEGSITLGKTLARLCVGGKVPKSSADIAAALKSIAKDASVVAGPVLDAAHEYSNKVWAAFNTFGKTDDLATELVAVIEKTAGIFTGVPNHGKMKGTMGWEGTTIADFGQFRLYNFWPEVVSTLKNEKISDTGKLQKTFVLGGFLKESWTIQSGDQFSSVAKEAASTEIANASKKEVHAILDAALEAFDMIEKSFSKYDRAWDESQATLVWFGTFGWTSKSRACKSIGISVIHNAQYPIYHTIVELSKSANAALKFAEKSIKAAGAKVPDYDEPELETVPAI